MKAAAILKRAQEELARHEASIRAHEAEISTHETDLAEHEKAGNTPNTTHQHAEPNHTKHKKQHKATQAHHERIMQALRTLDAALK